GSTGLRRSRHRKQLPPPIPRRNLSWQRSILRRLQRRRRSTRGPDHLRQKRRGDSLSAKLLCAAFLTLPLAAQIPDTSELRGAAQEVLLDLIVRDKAGRSVRDLKPEDIEILEEGKPQTITSFRFYDGKSSTLLVNSSGAADS